MPVHFDVMHFTGKSIGFASYLSRHPSLLTWMSTEVTCETHASPSDFCDKKIVVKTIEEIEPGLLKNSLRHLHPTNQKERPINEQQKT